MQLIETIAELRGQIHKLQQANKLKAIVGLVPTMGYLHKGHASLLKRAREECTIVVLSIFVNPLQFGPLEDLERYPRNIQGDLLIAQEEQADLIFAPTTAEMYPGKLKTKVSVSQLTDLLCGATRPGHFDGVATVVAKLLHIVEPDKVYFGLKDAQQVAVISQIIRDLNFKSEVVPCPTVRESDGLAMSSRNVLLTSAEREQAVVISQALNHAAEWLAQSRDMNRLKSKIREWIATAPLAMIEYVEVLSYPTLQEWPEENNQHHAIQDSALLVAIAVKFGQTRLIDNILLERTEYDAKNHDEIQNTPRHSN